MNPKSISQILSLKSLEISKILKELETLEGSEVSVQSKLEMILVKSHLDLASRLLNRIAGGVK